MYIGSFAVPVLPASGEPLQAPGTPKPCQIKVLKCSVYAFYMTGFFETNKTKRPSSKLDKNQLCNEQMSLKFGLHWEFVGNILRYLIYVNSRRLNLDISTGNFAVFYT